MRKGVGQAPTTGEQTQQKPCRSSSDIGAEEENHTVGQGPTYDRKGLVWAIDTVTLSSRVNVLLVSSVVKLCTINSRRMLLAADVTTQHSLLCHSFLLCRSGLLYVVKLPSGYATRQDTLVELAALTDRRS
jgi:hypothetical protein